MSYNFMLASFLLINFAAISFLFGLSVINLIFYVLLTLKLRKIINLLPGFSQHLLELTLAFSGLNELLQEVDAKNDMLAKYVQGIIKNDKTNLIN